MLFPKETNEHSHGSGDPGIIAAQPDYIIQELLAGSLTMSEVVLPAMSKKVRVFFPV